MAKTSVRLTMFADPHEVDEDEIPNLRAQGLLIEDEPEAAAPAEAAPAADAKPTRKPAQKEA